MKLAEALAERKAIKTKMEELKQRIYRNAQVQEGETPAERPEDLVTELRGKTAEFAVLVTRINAANAAARLPDGERLGAAVLRKDMLRYVQTVCSNLADKATPTVSRYSHREIRTVAAINIESLRRNADEMAKEYRLLDLRIQEANWQVELQDE